MRDRWPELVTGNPVLADSYTLNEDGPQLGPGKYVYTVSDNLTGELYWYNPELSSEVTDASNFMILMETSSGIESGHNTPVAWFRWDHRNHTSSNVLFLDGHVDLRTPQEILTPPWTPWPNQSNQSSGFRSFWFGRPDATDVIFK